MDGPDMRERAREMASALCRGFVAHDDGDRAEAIEAFSTVDRHQFAHLDEERAREASVAYVDALFAKDDVELEHLRNGDLDAESLDATDWGPVLRQFRIRAATAGIDPEYARASATAWRRHKTGGDYWTPMQRAQMLELRAALADPSYPGKPKYGQSGFGPEPVRYVAGVELHDMHSESHWEQAITVMTPYFERILRGHDDE